MEWAKPTMSSFSTTISRAGPDREHFVKLLHNIHHHIAFSCFFFNSIPPPRPPPLNILSEVVTEAFGVALVGYVASLALAQDSAKRYNYSVDDNQVICSLFFFSIF